MTGLPLIVEVLLIVSLSLLLNQSDQEKQREADYRHFSALCARIQAIATEAPYFVFVAVQSDSDKAMREYNKKVKSILKYMAEVQDIANKRPELRIKRSFQLEERIPKIVAIVSKVAEARETGDGMLELMQRLPELKTEAGASRNDVTVGLNQIISQGERLTRQTQQRRSNIQRLQTLIIVIGVILNAAVGIILFIFYRRDIMKRLEVIQANTNALSLKNSLSAPLSGNDEIALLDHAFHSMYKQLVEASERQKDLFENASDVICVIDTNDRFSKVNPASEKLWGYVPADMIGRSLWDLIADESKSETEDYIAQAKHTKSPVSFENSLNSKSGKQLEALWSAYWSDHEQSLFCIVHDISDRKQIERAKKQFLAMVSNDLKSPLSAISAGVRNLVSDLSNTLPEKAVSKLDIARKNVQRLLVLVNDLLQVTEMDTGNLEIKKEQADVAEILYRAVQDVEAVADKHSVNLFVQPVTAQWFIDPNRIMQVLVNLLSNAIKFSPENSTVTLAAEQQGDYIVCKVIDKGRGIPESHKKAIFEKFKQVEASDGKRKSGTGLGLPICKQIVEEHGGTIAVDSQEGQGSIFWFRVPRDESVSMRLRAENIAAANKAAITNKVEKESSTAGESQKVRPFASGGLGSFNLLTKGAVLVGVPIAFELVFVLAICTVLQQVDKERSIELHQRMIAFNATKMMNYQFQTALMLSEVKTARSWLDIVAMAKDADKTNRLLLKLVKNDPAALSHMKRVNEQWQKIRDFFEHAEKVMIEHNHNPAFLPSALSHKDDQIPMGIAVAHRIQKVIDDAERLEFYSPAKQEKLRKRQGEVLLCGLAANLAISILLAYFFTRDITGRLVILADNADRLARGKQLNPELPGSDEIAILDHKFHQSAAALAEARQKESAVFDNSQDVICAIGPNGQFISINPACERVWGYSKDDLEELALLDIIVNEDREKTAETLLGDFGNQQHIDFESRIFSKTGEEKFVLWSASRAASQSTTFCIARDITDKKQLDSLKQEFLAMVSHDLRTPLTSIIGVSKLISAGAFGAISEKPMSVLHGIARDGDMLLELINDLLDIEKLEAGKMQLVLESAPVQTIIEKSVAGSKVADAVQVSIDASCQDLKLNCDQDRTVQSIANLLKFAYSYLSGSDKVNLHAAFDNSEHLEITIWCNGLTFSEKAKNQIFERFNDASKSTLRHQAGSDLALPLARMVIEGHGGKINIDSNTTGSCSFVVSFPVKSRALK